MVAGFNLFLYNPLTMNISVIIPVYNEVRTIQEIVRRVMDVGLVSEILIIDDGSTDGTRDLLEEISADSSIRVILHERNQGKGMAVRTGIQAAKGDIMLIQDADLEYDPRDYPALLKPLEEDIADVVYGSRFLGGPRRPSREDVPDRDTDRVGRSGPRSRRGRCR